MAAFTTQGMKTLILRSRILACVSSLLILSGCSSDLGQLLGSDPDTDTSTGAGTIDGAGAQSLVVGDEPLAVGVGARILGAGGSAADAATAMYFALAVTYPVAGGLGGGGICLVHDTGRTEEIDFLARDSAGGGAYAVPGNVRGFAALQGSYGTLPWQRDIAPGERYASTGFTVSRALAVRLAAAQDVIRLDANLAAEFLDESGAARPAGATVSNPDLGQTLAAIRTGGPDAFYAGAVGAHIIAYSSLQGGAIGVAEFAGYRAVRATPQVMQIGSQSVLLPRLGTGAGAFAGALFDTLARAQATDIGAADPQAAVIVAVKQALAKFAITSLPSDLGATGFAAVDARGQSVACAVTMNGPFGSGHSATGTGVTLARAPSAGPAGIASAFLTPVIATDGQGAATLTGAGAGGPNGTAAIGYALARLGRGDPLASRSDLRTTGVAPFDTVNVIVCQGGVCVALPDPGANGLGASGDVGH